MQAEACSTERGVTLIELLISITLVAAISTGLLLAMRTSLLTYDKVNQRLEDDRRALGMEQGLERQISSVIPIVATCGSARVPLFSGDQQSLRFLSAHSLAEGSRGMLRIVEYQVAPDPHGGVRLMSNERLFGGPATVATLCSGSGGLLSPVQIGAQSVEAAGGLAFCRISYRENVPDNPAAGNWVPAWNRNTLPAAVRIETAPLASLAPHLAMRTLSVPLRITRDLGATYDDN